MAAILRRVSSSMGNVGSTPLLAAKQISKPQAAGMISKALRDKDFKRPAPFPYKHKDYGPLASIFEQTTWRFDENSKIIVVDGQITSGKDKIARKIASEFDLHYIPHANMDSVYINSYGFDIRTLNHKMPLKFKSFEPKDFVANPNDVRAAILQINLFDIRFNQYLDALTHLMSTGQGVVMNRSVYSDFVFFETYLKFGFLPKTFKKNYYETWNCLWPAILKPHAVVYLDTPVEAIRDNLKKRGNRAEIESPAYQPEVLAELEKNYKHKFLKNISSHAELLVYDNTEELDTEILVEDIERLNLDDYPKHDSKMNDWRMVDEEAWTTKRIQYTRDREELARYTTHVPCWDCPEIVVSGEDRLEAWHVKTNSPGNKYRKGYNADMGDANLLWKI